MTESEWLSSGNPAATLAHCLRWPTGDESGGREHHPHRPSDRKLRLFACACCERYGVDVDTDVERDRIGDHAAWAMSWARVARQSDGGVWSYRTCRSEPDIRAALLRCICGNPWRPVAVRETVPSCWPHTEYVFHPYWLTPAVIALAMSAYEARPGKKCERCEGCGILGVGYGSAGVKACPDCRGTGRIEDGFLDQQILMVLHDALLDAGAEGEILTHLRTPGSHYRGCWAIDFILGKS